MTRYSNELAPWEQRKQYYESIQLGKDVRTQTRLISESTEVMLSAQIASTNAIVSSQEALREGIEDLAYGIDRVEQGIAGLQAAFEWGISEVVWQIEQNREALRTILEVLSAPLDTQAKELRKRAEEAYSNGWFEDALEDFLESERKNRYDFSIHISLGMIHLFHGIDKEKALDCFEKAIKYAKPKSNYHTSFALLHKGLIKRDFGLIEEAEKCTSDAVGLSPDFAEAWYQNALYNSIMRNDSKAVKSLREAIMIDRNYCIKASHDDGFGWMKPRLDNLFAEFRDHAVSIATVKHSEITRVILFVQKEKGRIREITGKASSLGDAQEYNISRILENASTRIKRNSYFDTLDAASALNKADGLVREYQQDVISSIKGLATEAAATGNSVISSHASKKKSSRKSLAKTITVLSYFLGIGGCVATGPFADSLGILTSSQMGWSYLLALLCIIGMPLIGKAVAAAVGAAVPTGIPSEAKKHYERASQLRQILSDVEAFFKNPIQG